jgi:hypothetical protein
VQGKVGKKCPVQHLLAQSTEVLLEGRSGIRAREVYICLQKVALASDHLSYQQIKVKVKVVPALSLAEHHAMKAY